MCFLDFELDTFCLFWTFILGIIDVYFQGVTRLLLTKIPFYKEVVLMSFECEHCGFKNNELQPGGKIEERGVRVTLNVQTESDLNRQVVKSDYTSVKIMELDFEIPAQSQKGGR
jgi:zinc finger protein